MRRFISWVLVLAVVGVIGYDVWTWTTAARTLDDVTYDLTMQASTLAAPGATREQVGVQLVQQANPRGVRVYQYDQSETGVRVWTETDVEGTIVLDGIWNLFNGVAISEAFTTPFIIRDYGEAGIK